MASQRKSPMDHPVVVTFLILAVIGAMSLAAEVLKPLALAVLLSFSMAPLAGFFERRRVPRAIAVLLTVGLALGSLGGIGFVVVRQPHHAGPKTAELSGANPEESELPEAIGRHCALSGTEGDAASEGLSGVGPTHVAFSLSDARDQILTRAAPAVPATVVRRRR